FLLFLEFLEHAIELVEALRPGALVGLHPVVDRLQRPAVEAVESLPPRVPHLDGSDFPQHPPAPRDLPPGEAELGDEVVDRALAAGEDVEDLPAPRLRDRVERVRRRRCPCHGGIIYRYRNMSRRSSSTGDAAIRRDEDPGLVSSKSSRDANQQ